VLLDTSRRLGGLEAESIDRSGGQQVLDKIKEAVVGALMGHVGNAGMRTAGKIGLEMVKHPVKTLTGAGVMYGATAPVHETISNYGPATNRLQQAVQEV